MVMTRPSGGFRHLFVVGALALMAASGCSNSDRPTSSASSTTEPQTSDMPTAGVKQFCTEFAEVLSSEDPDFDRLKASAPKEEIMYNRTTYKTQEIKSQENLR